MPSPVGHALAGLAIAWAAPQGTPARRRSRLARALAEPLAIACAVLAALPDADLLLAGTHRTASHSITAVVLVTIITAAVTGWVTGRLSLRTALVCGAAYGSHLLLDWLGTDDRNPPFGIQLFWPFGDGYYVSGVNVFPGTQRRDILSAPSIGQNVKALLTELAIMGPVAAAAWLARSRRPPAGPSGQRPPERADVRAGAGTNEHAGVK
jgi:membrane-bound metal-dependent hydrolase YbcI (DUF457 family)